MLRLSPRTLSLVGALFLVGACGPAPVAPPVSVPVAPAASAPEPAPPPQPATIAAGAMPAGVQLYAEISGAHALQGLMQGATGSPAIDGLREVAMRGLRLSAEQADRLFGAVESIHLGGHFGGRKEHDGMKLAASVRFSDAQSVRDLVASGAMTEGGTFGALGRRMKLNAPGSVIVVWFEAARLLAVGDEAMVQAVASVVEGRAPEIGDKERAVLGPADAGGIRAFVAPSLLDEIVEGAVSFPAPLTLAYGAWEGGLRGAYRASVAEQGFAAQFPLPPPRALALARRLPAETAGYLAFSSAFPGGKQAAVQVVAQLAGLDLERDIGMLARVLSGSGAQLGDLLGGLGGEGVAAVVVRPGVTSQRELEHGYAVVILQEVADVAAMKRRLDAAPAGLSGQWKKAKVRAEAGGFSAEIPTTPIPFARVRLAGGLLFIGIGERDMVDRTLAAVDKGKATLGDDAAHNRALAGLPPNAQLRLWIDTSRALGLLSSGSPPELRAQLDPLRSTAQGPSRVTTGLSFSLVPESDRVRIELDDVNGAGTFGALAVFGVRRYLTAAKSAEAKNTVAAITRAAAAAFEREQMPAPGQANAPLHALCKSAQPVPTAVPHGVKFASQPSEWETGDAQRGWRCLKFALSAPQYYRYTYTAGGPYKGPARGGPDPGPDGFEVAAEGDLNGDGVTSLYTRVGTVDRQTGTVELSPAIFIDKELE
jgi:hypothetical protein